MLFSSMRIIARRTLREFVEGRRGYRDHAALKTAVDAWFDEVKKAHWSSAADVKRSYATASIVSADRVVFNIKGTIIDWSWRSTSRKASFGSSGSALTGT